jgi:hypothetical protein
MNLSGKPFFWGRIISSHWCNHFYVVELYCNYNIYAGNAYNIRSYAIEWEKPENNGAGCARPIMQTS